MRRSKADRPKKTRKSDMRRSKADRPKKRKTLLWILGWLFIFPVPLTILMLRKKDMNLVIKCGIIVVGWIVFFSIVKTGDSGSPGEETSRNQATNTSEVAGNISEITFSNTKDVTLKIGQRYNSGNVEVKVKKKKEFSPDDVKFISDDPNVATIEYTDSFLTTMLYYDITAKGTGETTVYVVSSDGSVSSEKIKVVVPQPVEVESISFSGVNSNLILGEHLSVTANVLPENAENKTISWVSSDESVATIDNEGNITAVGGGLSTITAKAANGVTESFELTVDGTKRVMNLRVTHTRDDDNNIGDDWDFVTMVNGYSVGGEYVISVGDTLSFSAEYTEYDDKPDVGKASKSYTVTEDDLINGFTVSMDLYVKENGGRNRGKSAHFIVKYIYTPK